VEYCLVSTREFFNGLLSTLELFIIAAVVGLFIGILLCYIMEYQNRVIDRIIIAFVSLMRAVPFLILAYLLYYGLPQLGISMEAWTAGLLALVIYHGAYFFEYYAASAVYFLQVILKPLCRRGFLVIKSFSVSSCLIFSLLRCR
jgi:polar amino acid transport system permease protein